MDFGGVFNLLIWLVIFAAVVYLIQGAPINEGIKRVITTVAVVAAVIWAIRWLIGLRH